MTQKLFIPAKLKVGYQSRKDTFTGKLGYVIYYDEKGVLRKEKSWNSWCDAKLGNQEMENKPKSGFIIDQAILRDSYYWGNGHNVIRIHDPEGFEFEVSCPNLIGILIHSDVTKRELQGEFVYAWCGTELVLLPTNSKDYQESVAYTEKQSMKISAKSLIKGATYQAKKSDLTYVYIGYYNWFELEEKRNKVDRKKLDFHGQVDKGKKHIFYDGRKFTPVSPATLAVVVNPEPVDNYAELVDTFFGTINSQPIVGFAVHPLTLDDLKHTISDARNDSEFRFYSHNGMCVGKLDANGVVESLGDLVLGKKKGKYLPTIDGCLYLAASERTATFTESGLQWEIYNPTSNRYGYSYYHYQRSSVAVDKDEVRNKFLSATNAKERVKYESGRTLAEDTGYTIEDLLDLVTNYLGYGKLVAVLKDGKTINNPTFL